VLVGVVEVDVDVRVDVDVVEVEDVRCGLLLNPWACMDETRERRNDRDARTESILG
jgi:hypothetical protein